MFAKAVEIKTALAAKDVKMLEEATAIRRDIAILAAKKGDSIMGPGSFRERIRSPRSFGMALMFGTAGLPTS